MKTYLNREEKQSYFILNGYGKYMNKMVDILKDKKVSTELLKNLKMARTYTIKSVIEMIKNVDKDQFLNLEKESAKTQVVAKYTKEAIEEFEKMKLMDSVTPVDTEDLYDIFNHCIKVCELCKVSFKSSENCITKKLLLKYGCEPINYGTEDKQCPYQYHELETDNKDI